MAFAFIQSRASGTGAEPRNLAYNSALTSGSLLIAAVFWNSSTATCAVSDPTNGTWTAAGSPQVGLDTLAAWRLQLFYAIGNVATTAVTVTADISSSVNAALAIHEYSGTSPTVDGTPVSNNGQNTLNPSTGSITTTVAGDLLWAACVSENQVTTAGSGYTAREHTNWSDAMTEDDLDGGAAGSKTAGFTCAGSEDFITAFIAFKEGGGVDTGLAWIRA